MKLARYATMLAAAAGLFVACQKLDEAKVFSPEQVVSPVLRALPAEIAITAENMGEIQTFTWDAADFGVLTQSNYSIEAAGGDEAPVVLFSDLTGTSTEQPYESINTKLVYDVGVEPDTPTEVMFYIGATIGTDYKKVYSEPVSVTMTVTKAERVYPTVWVIGDYCGWSHDNSQFLFSFLDDEINYEGLIDFGEKAANGFKLTCIAGWDDSCNWGHAHLQRRFGQYRHLLEALLSLCLRPQLADAHQEPVVRPAGHRGRRRRQLGQRPRHGVRREDAALLGRRDARGR